MRGRLSRIEALAVGVFWLVVAGGVLCVSRRARVWVRRLPNRLRPGWANLYRHERWALVGLLVLIWVPVALGVRRWSDNVPTTVFAVFAVIWMSDRRPPPSRAYLAVKRRLTAPRWHRPDAQP